MMDNQNVTRTVTDEDRREFLKVLGVAGAAAVGKTAVEDVTLSDLREVVAAESSAELAEMGRAIRGDLTAELDASLLASEAAGVAEAIERLPAVREQGFPDRGESLYGELTSGAWAIEEHLTETGFFASAEANLPRFTPEHVEAMVKQLVNAEALSTTLSEVGFSEAEQTALVTNVVGRADELAAWAPTWLLEDAEVEEVNADYVAPLQQRAAGGALLWIDGMDEHLFQNEVLITEEMLDRAVRDVRAMLGGVYLLGSAAEGIADGEISDEELTALVSGSTAITISAQLEFTSDLVRITDDMRAPRQGGA